MKELIWEQYVSPEVQKYLITFTIVGKEFKRNNYTRIIGETEEKFPFVDESFSKNLEFLADETAKVLLDISSKVPALPLFTENLLIHLFHY